MAHTKIYQCNLCTHTSNNYHILKRHEKRHIDIYKCNYCPKTCSSQVDLKNHTIRIHNEGYIPKPRPPSQNNFACNLCSKSYKSKRALISHETFVHKGLKIHQCKSYSDYTPLSIHMKTAHTEKGSYKCDKCEKIFSTEPNMKAHYRRSHIMKDAKVE